MSVNIQTPVQTWPITSLIEYNTEKKHLFIELSSPPSPASFHFHTETRAIAAEISDAIGEIAGAARASGLREVAAASGEPLPPLPESSALAHRHKNEELEDLPIDDGIKRGLVLYDFDPQGDDELGVRQDQIVEILDDSHEEWWKCKAGSREGVVPASYIDVIKTRPGPKKDHSSGGTSVAAAKALATAVASSSSSVTAKAAQGKHPQSSQDLSKPDPSKLRTWTDRSGTFKVEAQFLGLADGKIQLHKLNGVKISVPLTKMSLEDVEYVERLTGRDTSPSPPQPPPNSDKPRSKRIEYDWYSFFLESGVDYNVAQRYARAFEQDQMDESVLPDINEGTLRTLGVREGDILRIMKRLDEKFGRSTIRKKSVRFGGEEIVEDEEKDELADVVKHTQPVERKEGLFSSGPGGALRNNTQRRGRPSAGKTAPEEVDGSLLSTATPAENAEPPQLHGLRPLRVPPSRLSNFTEQKPTSGGFEDDAWAPKKESAGPQSQTQSQPQPRLQAPLPVQTSPPPGSAIHDLANINPQNLSATPQPPIQPQPLQPQVTLVQPQLSPQPPPPVVNRPSSVPPTQHAPQLPALQPHYTGVPNQSHFTGPTPAQASGVESLNDQLAKLQIYRQQQMLQAPQQGYGQPMQPQQDGYTNGFALSNPQFQPLVPIAIAPQSRGVVSNFIPPGQQNPQLGVTRSTSMGLPPPLLPTTTVSPPQAQFLSPSLTGPANFGPPPKHFQPQQSPAFQPATQNRQPQPGFQSPIPLQPTGFQSSPPQQSFPSQAGFLPPSTIVPQQTGFQQQMLPQQTGSPAVFKPVSFGLNPKPLVPTKTGRRANLAAASMASFAIFADGSSARESIWVLDMTAAWCTGHCSPLFLRLCSI